MSSNLSIIEPRGVTGGPGGGSPEGGPVGAPVVRRIDALIGSTPLVRLRRLGREGGAPIYLKMENRNPSGSVRDRYMADIVGRAVRAGQLMAGDAVSLAGIDDSSVAAALLCRLSGVRVNVFAPSNADRRLLPMLERYGAELVWTEPSGGIRGAIDEAADWARGGPDRLYIDGFRREAVLGGYVSIAEEITEALADRHLGAFITSVSTGATFRHVARELRQTHPHLKVGGAVLIDADFEELGALPNNILRHIPGEEAWSMRDMVAREEGLLLSPKGAASVALALTLQRQLDADRPIVAMNPDSGQRYLGWEDETHFSAGLDGSSEPISTTGI